MRFVKCVAPYYLDNGKALGGVMDFPKQTGTAPMVTDAPKGWAE